MTDPIADALARPEGQPDALLDAVGRLAGEVTACPLVTLMVFDPVTREAGRIWTSMPGPYPVSGRKPMNATRWSDTVLDRHETFVANTIEEIAEVFPDHSLILSLGCESVMNLPAVVGGQVLGTLNCLGPRGHFTPERLARAEALRLPTTAAFLFHLHQEKGAAA